MPPTGIQDDRQAEDYGSPLAPSDLDGRLHFGSLDRPVIIASQFAAGGIGAWAHHLIGNVDLHPRNRAFRVASLLASTSVLGTGAGAMGPVYLPALYLQAWVGFLVCAIGIITISLSRRNFPFSWKRIVALGVVAAFNKGSTGGGYGPLG